MSKKSIVKYTFVPTDEIPERQGYRGWANIIKDFVKSGEKYAYIQFDNKEDVTSVGRGLSTAGRSRKVKVSQHTNLLRVYLEKL